MIRHRLIRSSVRTGAPSPLRGEGFDGRGARRPRRAKPRYKVLSVLREERPPAGPFLNDQKGAKESVKEGDFDFPLLDNPPLKTTNQGKKGPKWSPAKRVRWGKDGPRRQQAEGRGAGSGAGEDAHGHAGGGGRLPVELHGPVPEKAAGAVRPRKKGLRCMRRPLSMGRQFQKFGNSSSEITFTSSRSSTTTTAGRTILLHS